MIYDLIDRLVRRILNVPRNDDCEQVRVEDEPREWLDVEEVYCDFGDPVG